MKQISVVSTSILLEEAIIPCFQGKNVRFVPHNGPVLIFFIPDFCTPVEVYGVISSMSTSVNCTLFLLHKVQGDKA